MHEKHYQLPEELNDPLIDALERKDSALVSQQLAALIAQGHALILPQLRLSTLDRENEYTLMEAAFVFECPMAVIEPLVDALILQSTLRGGSDSTWLRFLAQFSLTHERRDVWRHLMDHPHIDDGFDDFRKIAVFAAVEAMPPSSRSVAIQTVEAFVADLAERRTVTLESHYGTSPLVRYLEKVVQNDGDYSHAVLAFLINATEDFNCTGTSSVSALDAALAIESAQRRLEVLEMLVVAGAREVSHPVVSVATFEEIDRLKETPTFASRQKRCLEVVDDDIGCDSLEEFVVLQHALRHGPGSPAASEALRVLPLAAVQRWVEQALSPDDALLLISTLEGACAQRPDVGELVWPIISAWAKNHHAELSDAALWCLLRVGAVGMDLATPIVESGRRFGVLSPVQHALVNRAVCALSCFLGVPGALADDDAGNTPLHYALSALNRSNEQTVIDSLLQAGCDPSAGNCEGITPALLLLTAQGREFGDREAQDILPSDMTTLRQLFDAGADFTITDRRGRSARDLLRDAMARRAFRGPEVEENLRNLLREVDARSGQRHVSARPRRTVKQAL